MMALLQGFDLSVYTPRCYVVAATDGMSGAKAAAFEAAAAPAAFADEEAPGSAKKRTPGRGAATPAKSAVQQQAVRRSPRVAAAARQQQAAAAAGRRQLPGALSPESPVKRRMAAAAAAAQQQEQYSVVVIPRSREVGQSFLSSVPTTLRALWSAGARCSGDRQHWSTLLGLQSAAQTFWKFLFLACFGAMLWLVCLRRCALLAIPPTAERFTCSAFVPRSGCRAGAATGRRAAQRPRHLHTHRRRRRAAAVRWGLRGSGRGCERHL